MGKLLEAEKTTVFEGKFDTFMQRVVPAHYHDKVVRNAKTVALETEEGSVVREWEVEPQLSVKYTDDTEIHFSGPLRNVQINRVLPISEHTAVECTLFHSEYPEAEGSATKTMMQVVLPSEAGILVRSNGTVAFLTDESPDDVIEEFKVVMPDFLTADVKLKPFRELRKLIPSLVYEAQVPAA